MSTATELVSRLAALYSDLDGFVMESDSAADLALIEKEAGFYGGETVALAERASQKSVDVPL